MFNKEFAYLEAIRTCSCCLQTMDGTIALQTVCAGFAYLPTSPNLQTNIREEGEMS
jgi:hypothetical protein